MIDIKIGVIGLGYVGLISSLCFAKAGFKVLGLDSDDKRITALLLQEPPFFEPKLEELLRDKVIAKNLSYTLSLQELVEQCEILFICIGTPLNPAGYHDLSPLHTLIDCLAPLLTDKKSIVIKSTVPPGTCRKLSRQLSHKNPEASFELIANPEFQRTGNAIDDFLHPDRIIIGTCDGSPNQIIEMIYRFIIQPNIPFMTTNWESAELIKVASNSYLATRLAFVNEIAWLCESLGLSCKSVLHGIGLDRRIGQVYFNPGPGFGGSCLMKDSMALVNIGKTSHTQMHMTEAALLSNTIHKEKVLNQIMSVCEFDVRGKNITLWGLSFKANTDDIRESSAVYILTELISRGAFVRVYDPVVKKELLKSHLLFSENLVDSFNQTDLLIILTEWAEFKQANFQSLKPLFRSSDKLPLILDFRHLFDPLDPQLDGFEYYSFGHKSDRQSEMKSAPLFCQEAPILVDNS